jgi:CubicO group peptidase (beta-lactamase class C family)
MFMRLHGILFTLAVMAWCLTPAGADSFAWHTATPASQGMSAAKLQKLQDDLQRRQTKTLLVIRNDHIVWEWYAPNYDPDTSHYTASLAKALVGGVATAVAISDGRLDLDDRAAQYVQQWRSDSRKSRITVRQLGSHTSGLADAAAGKLSHAELTGWQGDFWKRLEPSRDPFTISRDEAPVLFQPGTDEQYSNPGFAMLSYVLTAALQDAPEKDIRTLLRNRIMRPIGVPDAAWSVGYGKTYIVDGLPLVASWGGGNYTARATASVGRLMLRRGNWDGKQLMSSTAVAQVTTTMDTADLAGIGWWSNAKGTIADLPRDAFWGSGDGHQVLLVVPSLDLIAVRNGNSLDGSLEHVKALVVRFFKPLLDTMTDAELPTDPDIDFPPYPPSEVIAGIDWAPVDTIVQEAPGSDNWPITWGDDDRQYTAYGDGQGFEPLVEKKLSLGLAVISGEPEDFTGQNLRSDDIEFVGEGKTGKKASGILMVDDVLYLWVRNADNSQLAMSGDHGRTWTWADWKFTEIFGFPTFLQFGRNYEGARDAYVYVYSFDSESAYVPGDGMVLARVRKDRLLERRAYEFYAGTDIDGEVRWSRDIEEREAVFEHPGRAYRLQVSYHAGLKRYFLVQILPESLDPDGPRFEGGFGVFDAPHPWGPWTTVFFTEHWDVGPGESASFPTKWMRDDNRTMYLVSSSQDMFSVREATLQVLDTEAKSQGTEAKSEQDKSGKR